MAFPSALFLLFDGFKESPDPAIQRSNMESGPPKQLRTMSRVMVTRPVKYLARSKSDYNAFVTWFRTDADWGAAWFNWSDPHDGVTKLARIAGGKYDAMPTRKDLERWIVSMSIETWSG